MSSILSESEFIEKDKCLENLKSLFPNEKAEKLSVAAAEAVTLNDAIDLVIKRDNGAEDSEMPTTLLSKMKFNSIQGLLFDYQDKINDKESEKQTLHIDRDDIWKGALSFYKKSMNNPKALLKSFEARENISPKIESHSTVCIKKPEAKLRSSNMHSLFLNYAH